MTSNAPGSGEEAGASAEVIRRHTLLVRITHWINAVSFLFLLLSGTAILVAHPEFYWGETGYFGDPTAFALPMEPILGPSGVGRTLHFFFAWVLVVNGIVYVLSGLFNGHFRRKFLPTAVQLRLQHLVREISEHARFRRPRGAAVREYNVLQKASYLLVVFVLLPVMLLTGLTMSPGVTAAFPELFTVFGGRQSARTIHFIAGTLLVLFLLVHVIQVFVVGFANEMRAMLTGKFVVDREQP